MDQATISTQSNQETENPVTKASASTLKTVLEVFAVFGAALSAMWIMELIPGFEAWQHGAFHHPIISTLLSIILFPLLALIVVGNIEKNAVIMNSTKLKKALAVGGKSFTVMMPATFLSFPIVGVLGYSFYGWHGGLIIAAVHLAAIPCLLLLFRNDGVIYEAGFSIPDLLRVLAILIISGGLIFGLKFIHEKLSQIVVMLVFVGFAEEFMFRGYMQGRLNKAFDKQYKIMNFSFGWGLIVAALLFGLMHVLSPGNPLHLAWGLWTFVAGICFGIIREKGGSFLASAFVHGTIMIFPVFFG